MFDLFAIFSVRYNLFIAWMFILGGIAGAVYFFLLSDGFLTVASLIAFIFGIFRRWSVSGQKPPFFP